MTTPEAGDPSAKTPRSGRTRTVRGYRDVSGTTVSDIPGQVRRQRARLLDRLASVGAVVAVGSGKGGVGKSAVTANLAVTLAGRGARVGVVDADLNGPSQGHMLGVIGARLGDSAEGVVPPRGAAGVKVVSTELLLEPGTPARWQGSETDRSIWQGVAEATALRELISDVVWEELDYLLIDIPPGTDKIHRFLDLLPAPDQLLVVTVPSSVATAVVARSATQVREAGISCAGLVVNMSGRWREHGASSPPPSEDADAHDLARSIGLELWAEIPFDATLGSATDRGEPPGARGESAAAHAFRQLADRVAGVGQGSGP